MAQFKFLFLSDFPKHQRILGRLLLAYAELEVRLLFILTKIHGHSIALKCMYRMRGETQRIQIVDGLAREAFQKIGLETEFSEAIADLQHAVSIRNQYAHASWHESQKRLTFVDLEVTAAEKGPVEHVPITQRKIPLALLKRQETFFVYVYDCLIFLRYAYEARTEGKKSSYHKPAKVARPPKYTGHKSLSGRRRTTAKKPKPKVKPG